MLEFDQNVLSKYHLKETSHDFKTIIRQRIKGIEKWWQITSPFLYLSVEVEHVLPYLAIFAHMLSQTLDFSSP
jgi:hypothetical protein